MFFVYSHLIFVFFFKQKTAYEMRISDWSSDVCSSDLGNLPRLGQGRLDVGCAGRELDQPVVDLTRGGVEGGAGCVELRIESLRAAFRAEDHRLLLGCLLLAAGALIQHNLTDAHHAHAPLHSSEHLDTFLLFLRNPPPYRPSYFFFI